MHRHLLCFAVVFWALASPALADPAPASGPAPMDPEAKAHFDKGSTYFEAQFYSKAVDEFKAGYVIDQNPEFLYAIAQGERLDGDCKDAVNAYRQFLAKSAASSDPTDAAKRQNAQAMVDNCTTSATPTPPSPSPTKQKATTAAPKAPAVTSPKTRVAPSSGPATPAPPAVVSPSVPSGMAADHASHTPAIATAVGAVVLVGAGVTMGLLGSSADHAAHSKPSSQQDATNDANTARTDYLVANILVPVGVVAGGLAAYLFWHESQGASTMDVAATPLPGGAAVSVSGTWSTP
jgi:hypothetical protein